MAYMQELLGESPIWEFLVSNARYVLAAHAVSKHILKPLYVFFVYFHSYLLLGAELCACLGTLILKMLLMTCRTVVVDILGSSQNNSQNQHASLFALLSLCC